MLTVELTLHTVQTNIHPLGVGSWAPLLCGSQILTILGFYDKFLDLSLLLKSFGHSCSTLTTQHQWSNNGFPDFLKVTGTRSDERAFKQLYHWATEDTRGLYSHTHTYSIWRFWTAFVVALWCNGPLKADLVGCSLAAKDLHTHTDENTGYIITRK